MNEEFPELAVTVSGIAAAPPQYIYLDFDGGETSYHGEILRIEQVSVADSGIGPDRAEEIAAALNEKYADRGAVFVTEKPENVPFSTVYIGRTAAFDRYGNFIGLAETVDQGNLNRSDNAFVLLDCSASAAELVSVIAHEAEHLLGLLDHGGPGLEKYGYQYYYTVVDDEYEYGYSDTIRNGNITNRTDVSNHMHNLTYSVKDPDTGSYVFVKEYKFGVGKPGETVSHPQPSIQSILAAIGISLGGGTVKYQDLYGAEFTIREKVYSTTGGKRSSDDYYCYDTLTVVATGTLLLQAPTLAVDNGITDYRNAVVKADQQTLSGLTVGDGGAGNLVVDTESEYRYGVLKNSTVTRNGRVEFDNGFMYDCTVENGGVVTLSDRAGAVSSEINRDGTFYYDGGESVGLFSTTVNAGGLLFVSDGNILDVTVNAYGVAAFCEGVSLNGDIEIEAGGRILIFGQLTKDVDCALTLDVSNNGDTDAAMVFDGLEYLPADTTVTINANIRQREGTYLLANRVDIAALRDINFTVGGQTLYDENGAPLSFTWDHSRYSSFFCNGQFYSLNTAYDTRYGWQLSLSVESNDTPERAADLGSAPITRQVTTASDPGYFRIESEVETPRRISVYGGGLTADSLTARIVDGEDNVISVFVWDVVHKRYVVEYGGEGFVYIRGNGEAETRYNISVGSGDDPTVPGIEYTTANFDVAVSGKQTRNFAVEKLAPGIYTFSDDFAPGLNATITVTDLVTGKKVGSLAIKNGAISKPTSFLLDGDYMFSITGDGKTAGECSITLDGKVNNSADHSDDNIELARLAAPTGFVYGSVGFGDTVDWIRTDIDAAGRHTVRLSGLAAAAKVTVTLWSSLNGGAAKKVASKSATGKDIVLSDLLLAYGDGMEYFVSVSCDNAAKGVFTDYTLSINGDVCDSPYVDNDNDVFDDDTETLVFHTGTATDRTTGGYLKSASVDGWVGYGDAVDVMTFDVSTPAQYGIELKADVAKAVTMKLRCVTVDPDTGAYKFTDVAGGKAGADGAISFSGLLQAGTFVLTVSSSDGKTDKFNTGYTLAVAETAKFATLNTSSGELFTMGKGEVRTFTLSSVQKISLNKTANLSLWTGNGKNGKSTVKLAYDKTTRTYGATLAPGTYFLSASDTIYDVRVTGSYPDGYGSSMFTDDNSFLSAASFYGYAVSFVGFGDGADYYRFTVDCDDFAPGGYTLSLGDAVSNYVSVTVYSEVVSKGKNSYKQIAKFTHKTGESTSVKLKDLIDGDYYIKVESLSYADPAKSKDTTYTLSLDSASAYKELTLGGSVNSSSSALAKGGYAYYRGTGDGGGLTLYRIDARVANGYEVYVNNGDGKLTKVKTFNNTFILEDDRLFYVRSTKDAKNYAQGIALSAVSGIVPGNRNDQYISGVDEGNLQHIVYSDGEDFRNGWSGWIGYSQPSASLEIGTGVMGAALSGWASFEIAAIDKTLADTSAVKFTLALEKLENGTWKKVASTTAQTAWDKKSGSFKLSVKKLEAAMADDSLYRVTVSASDKGAGQCSGSFTVNGSFDVFTPDDNTLATPTGLTSYVEGTVVKKYDFADVYELADIERFRLDMDSGSVKLTFYDGEYNAVALNGTYLTGASGTKTGTLKKAASVTLTADSAKADGILLASSELLEYGIRFAKIEAQGNGNNHYHIATAMPF